ncbi:unnamed protein product [Hermetia illucens]|uniref:Uncharacterized protein n=2 Tax=Hermetia illucens TaxID=343691 RepID=A0A7R8UX43_HERIL|nr:unnamed protein product [Hermetia illucens]
MKLLIILPLAFATAVAQRGFGGFSSFGRPGKIVDSFAGGLEDGKVGYSAADLTSDLNEGLGETANILSSIPKIPNIDNLPLPGTITDFADFIAKTGKKYASEAEQHLREGIFKTNQLLADTHNELFKAGKSAFEMGLNFLSDLKPEEFLAGLMGRKRNPKGEAMLKNRQSAPPLSAIVPDSFDWREKGAVTPVKFQGLTCNSCWSFAVTGSIEGHIFRKTNKLISLSEQNLIDCSAKNGNTGCGGGYHDYAYEYIIANQGISKTEPYPYLEKQQEKCHYQEADRGAEISAYYDIPHGNETYIKIVVATLGPVAASVNADLDTFKLYKQGIYEDDNCKSEKVTHEILIVGYGSEKGKDYWIIKNSWTDKWGDNGYMKILRNKNLCGIASEGSYPVV